MHAAYTSAVALRTATCKTRQFGVTSWCLDTMDMSAGSVNEPCRAQQDVRLSRTTLQHLGAALDPVGAADVNELGDGLAQGGVHEVVPKDAGRARVHQDVCIR